jgi:hypothetical protein
MFILRALLAALLLTRFAMAQEHVSFPTEDGGVVYADVYRNGERGVVLAHGGRFNQESWEKQAPLNRRSKVGCIGRCSVRIPLRGN